MVGEDSSKFTNSGGLNKNINHITLGMSMPKSLGQIHTANISQTVSAAGNKVLVDLPGILTNQLQHMVRQGQYFKIVGIDMTCQDLVGVQGEVAVSGVLRYYAPTKGRCEAYKAAYRAVRRGMSNQGINVRGNKHYDFRVPIVLPSTTLNGAINSFKNEATIDGTAGLTLDDSAASAKNRVFSNYNGNIQPAQTAGVAFSSGFGPAGFTVAGTDFVLNEGEYYEGSSVPFAEIQREEIPFAISFGQDAAQGLSSTMTMQWRPDPALYLAVLTGQFEVEILDINDSVPGTSVNLEMAFHVAGWKSIMGSGKRRSSKRASSKTTTTTKKVMKK